MIVTPPQCLGVSVLTMKSWEINSESNKLVQPTNQRPALLNYPTFPSKPDADAERENAKKKLEIGKMQKKLGNCKTRPVSKLSNLQIQNLDAPRSHICKTFTGSENLLFFDLFYPPSRIASSIWAMGCIENISSHWKFMKFS